MLRESAKKQSDFRLAQRAGVSLLANRNTRLRLIFRRKNSSYLKPAIAEKYALWRFPYALVLTADPYCRITIFDLSEIYQAPIFSIEERFIWQPATIEKISAVVHFA